MDLRSIPVLAFTIAALAPLQYSSTAPGKVNVKKVPLGTAVDGKIYQLIQWRRPHINHSNELNYTIKYGPKKNNHPLTVCITTHTTAVNLTIPIVTNKSGPLMYNIWVAAVSDAGEGPYSAKKILTYDVPDEPRDLKVSSMNCTSIHVTWAEPVADEKGGLQIDGFGIVYTEVSSGRSQNKSSHSTYIILDNLSPSTKYNISVGAQNAIGMSKYTSTIIKTDARDKGALNITERSESSLTFTQKISEAICKYKSTDSPQHSVHHFNITQVGHTLTGLKPDRNYKVDCVVYRVGMEACLKVSTSVKTLPSAVTNVRKSGQAKIMDDQIHQTISWNRPAQHTSALNYTIKFGPANGSEQSQSMATTFNSTIMVNLIIHIPKEPRPMRYNVRVATVSDAGQGQYSDVTVLSYDVPPKPRDVNVSMADCNKMTISWKNPSNTGGLPVESYDVFFTSSSGMSQNKSSNSTFITLDNLSPETQYTITVRAKNIIGWGNHSELVNASTKPRNTSASELYE